MSDHPARPKQPSARTHPVGFRKIDPRFPERRYNRLGRRSSPANAQSSADKSDIGHPKSELALMAESQPAKEMRPALILPNSQTLPKPARDLKVLFLCAFPGRFPLRCIFWPAPHLPRWHQSAGHDFSETKAFDRSEERR